MIRLTLPKPSPGFWPTAAALAAIYAALLGPFSCSAEGQAQGQQNGVGFPGVPRADFSYTWCEQKRPPGRTATCTDKAPPTFDCRLCPSGGWQGYYAEFFPRTEAMLRNGWEQNAWGTRETHSGVYTLPEFGWAEISTSRSHEWYRKYWYEATEEGGSEARPIVINAETLRFNTDRIDCMKALGAWPAPGATGSYIGFDPVAPVDVCTNRFPPPGARPLWPVWVRNDLPADHPVNQVSAPPPPPPEPVPDPVPPPPPTPPPCTSWQISAWLERCGRLASSAGRELADPAELCEWCERKRPAPTTTLAKLRGLVCEPVVCEVEPLPPVVEEPPPSEPKKLCPRVRVVVTPEEFVMPEFIPGIESTARLEIELVPQEWVECPEGTP